jgi:hypothetical protein
VKEEVIKCILGALLEAPWIKRSQSIEAENVYNTLLEAGYVVKKEEPKEPKLICPHCGKELFGILRVHQETSNQSWEVKPLEPPQADLLEELEKYLDAEISIKLTGLTRLQTLVEIRSKIQELKAAISHAEGEE